MIDNPLSLVCVEVHGKGYRPMSEHVNGIISKLGGPIHRFFDRHMLPIGKISTVTHCIQA